MLSEPKKKQRITSDPNQLNPQWSSNKNKFGYKLLEKMGWKEGKGLGLKENGIQQHIVISYKQDQLGLGQHSKSYEQWLSNQDAFNDLLKQLNQNSSGQISSEIKETEAVVLGGGSQGSLRLAHRSKFMKAKKSSTVSASVFEILGQASIPTFPEFPVIQSEVLLEKENDELTPNNDKEEKKLKRKEVKEKKKDTKENKEKIKEKSQPELLKKDSKLRKEEKQKSKKDKKERKEKKKERKLKKYTEQNQE